MLNNTISLRLKTSLYKIILFAHACETFRNYFFQIIFLEGFIICSKTHTYALTEPMIKYLAEVFHFFSPTFFLRYIANDSVTTML